MLGRLGPATRTVPLGGGKANTNLRVDRAHGPPLVVRVHQRDPRSAAMERAVMARVRGVVPVPALRGTGTTREGLPVSVVDWLPGRPLTHVLADDDVDALALGAAVGACLAPLHALPVEGVGLFGPDLSLARRFESVRHSFDDLVGYSLTRGRARRRLGPERVRRLQAALPGWGEQLAPLEAHRGLVHGDAKASNLLVARVGRGWRVQALLDWEFACAFTPLLDVAIFARHREALPLGLLDGFVRGYRGAGGWLPDDWQALTRVVDLMNLVGFLNAGGERPRLFARVLERVDGLLTTA